MHRVGRSSQIFSVTFAVLTIVLQCSQVCMATGHAIAIVLVPLASSRPTENHCHSQQPTPREPERACVNCRMPALVESGSVSGDRTASLAVSSVVFWLPPALLPVSLHLDVERLRSSDAGPPSLSYLHLSVLRL